MRQINQRSWMLQSSGGRQQRRWHKTPLGGPPPQSPVFCSVQQVFLQANSFLSTISFSEWILPPTSFCYLPSPVPASVQPPVLLSLLPDHLLPSCQSGPACIYLSPSACGFDRFLCLLTLVLC
ncbi:hypothetical protein AMECASPLE_038891 [Ameca splendens]|uniref:Uncharacterized protein n=1 Tax=Ameca splendens TaxID=208324 RepID=A0ABV0Z7Z7_9TELE